MAMMDIDDLYRINQINGLGANPIKSIAAVPGKAFNAVFGKLFGGGGSSHASRMAMYSQGWSQAEDSAKTTLAKAQPLYDKLMANVGTLQVNAEQVAQMAADTQSPAVGQAADAAANAANDAISSTQDLQAMLDDISAKNDTVEQGKAAGQTSNGSPAQRALDDLFRRSAPAFLSAIQAAQTKVARAAQVVQNALRLAQSDAKNRATQAAAQAQVDQQNALAQQLAQQQLQNQMMPPQLPGTGPSSFMTPQQMATPMPSYQPAPSFTPQYSPPPAAMPQYAPMPQPQYAYVPDNSAPTYDPSRGDGAPYQQFDPNAEATYGGDAGDESFLSGLGAVTFASAAAKASEIETQIRNRVRQILDASAKSNEPPPPPPEPKGMSSTTKLGLTALAAFAAYKIFTKKGKKK